MDRMILHPCFTVVFEDKYRSAERDLDWRLKLFSSFGNAFPAALIMGAPSIVDALIDWGWEASLFRALVEVHHDTGAHGRAFKALFKYFHFTERKLTETLITRCINYHNPTKDDIELFEFLLEKGADVNGERHQTPLMVASSITTMLFLLQHGADVKAQNWEGETALHCAVCSDQSEDRVKLLLNAGANPNAQTREGHTPLHYLVTHRTCYHFGGRPEPRVVSLLIKFGADVNLQDSQGRTPLHHAVLLHTSNGHEGVPQFVAVLLDGNADPNMVDRNNETPVFVASARGPLRFSASVNEDYAMAILPLLLDHGGRVNPSGPNERVPLVGTVVDRSALKSRVVALLLDRGVLVNAVDPVFQKSALSLVLEHLAHADMRKIKKFNNTMFERLNDIVELLLDKGAVPTWKDFAKAKYLNGRLKKRFGDMQSQQWKSQIRTFWLQVVQRWNHAV